MLRGPPSWDDLSTPWHPVPGFGLAFHAAVFMRGLLNGDIALGEAQHREQPCGDCGHQQHDWRASQVKSSAGTLAIAPKGVALMASGGSESRLPDMATSIDSPYTAQVIAVPQRGRNPFSSNWIPSR